MDQYQHHHHEGQQGNGKVGSRMSSSSATSSLGDFQDYHQPLSEFENDTIPPPVVPVAAAPKDDNLYEAMIRAQNEMESSSDDDSDIMLGRGRRRNRRFHKSYGNEFSTSLSSDEDDVSNQKLRSRSADGLLENDSKLPARAKNDYENDTKMPARITNVTKRPTPSSTSAVAATAATNKTPTVPSPFPSPNYPSTSSITSPTPSFGDAEFAECLAIDDDGGDNDGGLGASHGELSLASAAAAAAMDGGLGGSHGEFSLGASHGDLSLAAMEKPEMIARTTSDFYEAALEESRQMERFQQNRKAAAEAEKAEKAKLQKPGAIRVNEPAVRPDSAVYRMHYGEPPQRNLSSESLTGPSFPQPMNVDETRKAVVALKQSRQPLKGSNEDGDVDRIRQSRRDIGTGQRWTRQNHQQQQQRQQPRRSSGASLGSVGSLGSFGDLSAATEPNVMMHQHPTTAATTDAHRRRRSQSPRPHHSSRQAQPYHQNHFPDHPHQHHQQQIQPQQQQYRAVSPSNRPLPGQQPPNNTVVSSIRGGGRGGGGMGMGGALGPHSSHGVSSGPFQRPQQHHHGHGGMDRSNHSVATTGGIAAVGGRMPGGVGSRVRGISPKPLPRHDGTASNTGNFDQHPNVHRKAPPLHAPQPNRNIGGAKPMPPPGPPGGGHSPAYDRTTNKGHPQLQQQRPPPQQQLQQPRGMPDWDHPSNVSSSNRNMNANPNSRSPMRIGQAHHQQQPPVRSRSPNRTSLSQLPHHPQQYTQQRQQRQSFPAGPNANANDGAAFQAYGKPLPSYSGPNQIQQHPQPGGGSVRSSTNMRHQQHQYPPDLAHHQYRQPYHPQYGGAGVGNAVASSLSSSHQIRRGQQNEPKDVTRKSSVPEVVSGAMYPQPARRSRSSNATSTGAVAPDASSEPIDEDLALALELSKQEATAGGVSNTKRYNPSTGNNNQRNPSPLPSPPASLAAGTSLTTSQVFEEQERHMNMQGRQDGKGTATSGSSSSPGQSQVHESTAQSSFARAATQHVSEGSSGSLNDLLLALRLSAEDANKKGGNANSMYPTFGPSTLSASFRRGSTNLDELLALEMSTQGFGNARGGESSSGASGAGDRHGRHPSAVMDMIAAGISTTPGGDGSSSSSGGGGSADEQMRILQQIREEQERQELELAIRASQEQAQSIQIRDPITNSTSMQQNQGTIPTGQERDDFMWSQQQAIAEYSNNRGGGGATPGAHAHSSEDLHQEAKNVGWPQPQRENMTNHRQSSSRSVDSEGRRKELLQRGTIETKQAISAGQAHIVTCRGCGGRLQAPVSYSLVFCPKCQTISPA